MKRVNRFTMLLLLLLLAALPVIAGCTEKPADTDAGNTESDKPQQQEQNTSPQKSLLNTDSTYPITNEPITISMVVNRAQNGAPWEQMWFFKWITAKTNITFDVTQIELDAWREQKNILFASGNLPEVFLHTTFEVSDITQFGQVGQQFIPLNDLIDQYAPNIQKLFAEHPEVRAAVTSPDGNIYSLPTYTQYEPYSFHRPFIHRTWLEKLNLPEPETLDDLYNVLKAFKEQDPNGNGIADEIPFGGAWDQGYEERTVVLTALGFLADSFMSLSVKDDKVVLPEADPLYAEYLKYMHKLYDEGLLDKELFTQTQVQAQAKSSQNLNGVVLDGAAHIIDPERWMDYSALRPLTSEWNDEMIWPNSLPYGVGKFMITKAAQNPEAAIRFADLFFDEEFNLRFWYGPEQGSEDAMGYNGWYINENKAVTFDLPEGVANNWDYQNTLSPINGLPLGLAADIQSFEKIHNKKVEYEERAGYWRITTNEKVVPYLAPKLPLLYLSEAESERRDELYTPIYDYAKTMEAKFITGNEPLTDDNLEKYFAELRKLGVEEYVQIYQDAYEVYKQALK